ncbi:MAG: shikimate dehydrogenase [Anaerolineae bacterium]
MGRGITGRTRLVGLLGWPTEHSVSPAMQNAAIDAIGLDWCYVPLPVPPKGLPEAVAALRALGLVGANVTVPHKQAALPLMDEVSEEARVVGAVNTIILHDHRLLGHNTDVAGFLRALREAGIAPRGRVVVLGAGGAARAVVCALRQTAGEILILNRTAERAKSLADEMGKGRSYRVLGAALDAASLQSALDGASLLVNATSVGMWPDVNRSPWPQGVAYPTEVPLFDLVYNPQETALMRMAREAGARAENGLGMLVHQGAESLRLWSGKEPDVSIMKEACLEALEGGE